ncbi:hypothetical protein [Aeromicrobium marinum]|uniref:hypothetical protein n=1 Tax=Aeromicrobium marinum TaxID=219314 RepID=UPI0001D017DA|nr:hypothetical protein [Aeromicrobium marinum]
MSAAQEDLDRYDEPGEGRRRVTRVTRSRGGRSVYRRCAECSFWTRDSRRKADTALQQHREAKHGGKS